MQNFWKQLQKELKANHHVILLYVLHSEGSSPGRQGFKMFVSESGLLVGSIGGGIMEHKLVEWCKVDLLKSGFKPFIKHQIHKSDIKKDKSGMICSGEQTIAFYSLNQNTLTAINRIVQSIDKQDVGVLKLTENELSFDEEAEFNSKFKLSINNDSTWELVENLGFKPPLFIVGGGHVGLALSKLAKQLDFKVTVLDDRSGLNTVEANEIASFIKVPDYELIDQYIPQGNAHYVVLMSFGYRTDKVILKRLIDKQFKYLGMMGSKEKVKTLFQELEQEGFAKSRIDQVYSPIGIPINSKTPEEIAISILAELIQVKNAS